MVAASRLGGYSGQQEQGFQKTHCPFAPKKYPTDSLKNQSGITITKNKKYEKTKLLHVCLIAENQFSVETVQQNDAVGSDFSGENFFGKLV